MVKGITRQVILVKSPDPKLFEEAIFIVKEEALAREGVDAEHILKEARQAADGYLKPCLHSGDEYSLKGLDYDRMRAMMESVIWNKPEWHGDLDAIHRSRAGRNMNEIGG